MVDMLWKIWKPNHLKSGQMAAVLSWCCLVVLDCTLLHLFCSFKTLFSDFTAEINKKRLKSSSSSFLVHAAPKSWSKYTTRHFVKNHLKSGQTCLVFERWDFRSQQYHNFWNKQVCHSGHESCNLACLCFGKKCMFFKFKGSWNKKTFLLFCCSFSKDAWSRSWTLTFGRPTSYMSKKQRPHCQTSSKSKIYSRFSIRSHGSLRLDSQMSRHGVVTR